MADRLPVPVALSQLLIAFTIEHDNEWEMRYWLNANPAPLRTSLVMWANFVRFLTHEGISVRALSRKAGYPEKRVHPDLAGMIRWRYVTVSSVNPKKPKLDDMIYPTDRALAATATWQPLVAEIEDRWLVRFGRNNVTRLKEALVAILTAFDRPLPHYFPVLRHLKGMSVLTPHQPECDRPETLALPYLLSQVHHLFTLEADRASDISLAIRSNVLRVLDRELVDKKAVPQPSGISKEALSMSYTWLKRHDYLVEEPSPSGRGKAVRLTERGYFEKGRYAEIIDSTERAWVETISAEPYANLRTALKPFTDQMDGPDALLFEGLKPPHPEIWRAKLPPRTVLPHHPMVLYRGGWPDGS